MKPASIAIAFNDCINARSTEGLAALMAEGYTFIDTANNSSNGKARGLEDWQSFFKAFPDYQNILERVESRGDFVFIAGRSTCSHPELEGPALWTVRIEGDKVLEWRVYEDSPANRHGLGL